MTRATLPILQFVQRGGGVGRFRCIRDFLVIILNMGALIVCYEDV